MDAKSIVKAAVAFENPERIPLLYFNERVEQSDIQRFQYGFAKGFQDENNTRSEWGFRWKTVDGTMGQPYDPPITDWRLFDSFLPPDANASGRFDGLNEFIELHHDRYLIGQLGISGLNFVTYVRGYEETMMDLYCDKAEILKLIRMVFDFENGIIENYCNYAIDAVGFGDDLGTQQSLVISPDLWREIYKPLYQHQFETVHRQGKQVYFHSCGNIRSILPDLIEIGVDIFNFNQPDIYGIEELGGAFVGKCTFCCPVDHQTVAVSGTPEQISSYVRRLVQHLSTGKGGFIGYIEEYSSVGMSRENFEQICRCFEEISRQKKMEN